MYKKTQKKGGIYIGFLICLLLGSHMSFAQQNSVLYTGDIDNLTIEDPHNKLDANDASPVFTEEEKTNMDLLFQRYQEEIINGWESKTIYTQARLIKSKRDLEKKIEIYADSDQRIQEYNEILRPLEQKIISLQQQLQYLQNQIALTKYKVENVQQQITEKEEQIRSNMQEIAVAKAKVQNQEQVLMEYVRLIYNHEIQYYDLDTKSINDLKLLLADKPISQTISSGEYLEIIQKTGQQILEELEIEYISLTEKEMDLEDKQSRLKMLNEELIRQQQSLKEEQTAQQQLLETTQGDEQKFQELILEAEREKLQSATDIALLQENIPLIEKQLDSLRKNINNTDTGVVEKKAESAALLMETPTTEPIVDTLPWPIEPTQGLSAYFDDNNYVRIFGVNHGAVDIPAYQGTEIAAPADAFVYKAQDNGYGYNYIILAHRSGFLTLYGHVSKLMVQEGDLVRKGDIIGLSGGAPGTLGAGWRTTGAHLHFELWKDGKKVDPLLYLDLSVLPMEKVLKSMIPSTHETINLDQ